MPIARAALFLDYENLVATLKKRTADAHHPYGRPPKLDFERLVAFLESRFGALGRSDFIAVANFSHYNRQAGGLNRVATTIHVASFLPRQERRRRQSSPGKRYVYKNYADMRLAMEIGKHLATRPADVYLLCTGDGAFAAVARALQQAGKRVVFILPQPEMADSALLHDFEWLDYAEIEATFPLEEPEPEAPATPPTPEPDEVDRFCDVLATLRRALTTAIPVDLMLAIYGPERGQQLLNKAQGQGRIDLWDNPEGIRCLSLQSERLSGVVQKMSTRPEVAEQARLLRLIAEIAHRHRPRDRATWRRHLHAQGLTNRQAKALLTRLMELGILETAHLDQPRLTPERVLRLLQPDQRDPA